MYAFLYICCFKNKYIFIRFFLFYFIICCFMIFIIDRKIFDFLLENDSEDIDIDGEMAKNKYHSLMKSRKIFK